MKSLIFSLTLLLGSIITTSVTAQSVLKNETVKVWGNCETCKKHIEKAAKTAGASTASWNEESKELQLSYNSLKTSSQKIQQSIANAGYDTRDFKGKKSAYNKLDKCCRYDRKGAETPEKIKL